MMNQESSYPFLDNHDAIEIGEAESPQIESNHQSYNSDLHNINYTSLRTDTIPIEKADIKYKNLPKTIGNNYWKYLTKSKKGMLPEGAQRLVDKRAKTKQSQIKITDLQESCRDEESSQLFQDYIEKQLFIDLIFSNKISNCVNYIPGISNYYAAAKDPDKMKSNYILRGEFIEKKVKSNDLSQFF